MAHTVEEYKPMNVRQIYDHLSRFASDSQHSNDVDVRWLATQAQSFSELVASIMNCRVSPEARDEINAFRAGEIQKELERKRREVDALERDLKKVQPVKAA